MRDSTRSRTVTVWHDVSVDLTIEAVCRVTSDEVDIISCRLQFPCHEYSYSPDLMIRHDIAIIQGLAMDAASDGEARELEGRRDLATDAKIMEAKERC